MRAMKRDDIDIFSRLHRRNPHATTAFDVAVAMLLYRRQLPPEADAPEVRPRDIQDRLGITYDNARKALKRAADALDELGTTSMQPDDNHPDDNHPTGRSSTGRSSSGHPDDNHPVPPHPPYKDKGEGLSVCSSRAGACEGGGCEDADPTAPSPEPERRAVVRFVADLTGGNLEPWATQACKVYPAPWVKALVERKAIGGPAPRAEYLNSILMRWARARSCEYLDAPSIPLRATGTAGGSSSAPRRRGPIVSDMDI